MVDSAEVKGRVLVAEDDTALRRMIAGYLRWRGCEVDEASTVRELRAAVSMPAKYDVVISDIHLPDGDATDAIGQDRADIPVVFITGDDSNRLTSAAIATDPTGLLLKPFELMELYAMVAHALRHHPRGARQTQALFDEDPAPLQIVVRPQADHDRRMPAGSLIRTAILVAVMVTLAFLIGLSIMNGNGQSAQVVTPATAY